MFEIASKSSLQTAYTLNLPTTGCTREQVTHHPCVLLPHSDRHLIDNKTLDSLKKGKNITMITLEKLCRIIDCTPNDIVEFKWGCCTFLLWWPRFHFIRLSFGNCLLILYNTASPIWSLPKRQLKDSPRPCSYFRWPHSPKISARRILKNLFPFYQN